MQFLSIEKNLAKAFVFFLPFRMLLLLTPITDMFGAQSEYFSFVFHVIGISIYVMYRNGKMTIGKKSSSDIIKFFFKIIVAFSISSFVMSCLIDYEYGDYNGNSPYIAVLKLFLDFLQYVLIFVYCRIVFSILGSSNILKILVFSSRILLVLGYLQIVLLGFGKALLPLYDVVLGVFQFNTFNSQIALSFMEPSYAAMYLGCLVFPLHLSRLFTHEYRRVSPVIELLLWIPPWIYTKSTTAYLLVLTALGVALILRMLDTSSGRISKIVSITAIILGIIFLATIDFWDSIFGFNFSYLFVQKFMDLGNQSTASRTIPLVGDIFIFLEYPLFGCGNGLQGYFFDKLIPFNYYSGLSLDQATSQLLRGTFPSIPNGQLFVPAIFSGYGVFGVLLFYFFFKKCILNIKKQFSDNPLFAYMYTIAFLPIIIAGFKSEFIGVYYIWFVLSLPYAAFDQKI